MKKIIVAFLACTLFLSGCNFLKPTKTYEGVKALDALATIGKNKDNAYCEIFENDENLYKYWFSDDNFRLNIVKAGYNSIKRDNWIYAWGGSLETATKIKIDDMGEFSNELFDFENFDQSDLYTETKKMLEEQDLKYKVICKYNDVSNNDFSLPVGVEFKDLNEMMKNFNMNEISPDLGIEDDGELIDEGTSVENVLEQACEKCKAQGMPENLCTAVCDQE